jgi:hypothetical protein
MDLNDTSIVYISLYIAVEQRPLLLFRRSPYYLYLPHLSVIVVPRTPTDRLLLHRINNKR